MGCGTAPCVVAGAENGKWRSAVQLFRERKGPGWVVGVVCGWIAYVTLGVLASRRRNGSGGPGGEDLQQVCFGCLGEEERRT